MLAANRRERDGAIFGDVVERATDELRWVLLTCNTTTWRFTITITPSSVNPPQSGLLPGRVYDFSPHGLQFAIPPLLTIAYDQSDVPAGVDEASLIILSSLHGSAPLTDQDPWEERPSTVDATANRVSGTIEHFSHDGVGLPAVRVEMSELSITVPVGDTHPLTAVPFDAMNRALNHIVDWSSNNVAAAGVVPTSIQGQQLGTVIANAVGTAVVRAAVRNSAENVAGNTGVNVTARPRRVTFSGTIFELDDDFSPIGENDDCGQFTFQDFCDVTASAPTATIVIGGEPTCVDDEVMSTTTAVCTLDTTTESVTVSITTRLFEENACPNGDLDGQGSLTSVLAIGQSDSRSLHVDNTDEGGDFVDWTLTLTNVAATGPATRTIGGGSVSCP